jgi:hypothetical protein
MTKALSRTRSGCAPTERVAEILERFFLEDARLTSELLVELGKLGPDELYALFGSPLRKPAAPAEKPSAPAAPPIAEKPSAPAKLTAKARQAGTAVRVERSNKMAVDYAGVIAELQATGVTSLRGIAAALTERHVRTPRGGEAWQSEQVRRVLRKAV